MGGKTFFFPPFVLVAKIQSSLPKRETVFGISFNGISRAYPKLELGNSMEFEDVFGNKTVLISYDIAKDYLIAKELRNGEKLLVEKHWWFGWKEFHPDTEIWSNLHVTSTAH